jgi:hypothetical protein
MSKWISVKDRLPEKAHQDVLITDNKKIGIAHIGNDLKIWFDYFDCFHIAQFIMKI